MEVSLSHTEIWRENILGLLKALILVTFAAFMFISLFTLPTSPLRLTALTPSHTTPLTTVSYTNLSYPSFGSNPTPLITLPTKINGVSQKITYLIDSGAVVTSLPIHYAQNAAIDLSLLTRIILSSLTSQTVYGYMANAELNLGESEQSIPITFAAIDTPVLGRHGFFDNFTLIFNHTDQTITIATTNN